MKKIAFFFIKWALAHAIFSLGGWVFHVFFRIYLRFTGVPLKVGIGFVEIDFLAFLCVTLGCQKSRICKSESPRNAKKI